jgi:clavulanate-9-aldehyde reducatase
MQISSNMKEQCLEGRRIMVTGASSGIGEAIAREAAGAGATVSCLARRTEVIMQLAEELNGYAVPVDLTDPAGARSAVERSVSLMGGLDALINNAGIYLLSPIEDTDPYHWQRLMNINVLALLYCTQAAIPYLRESESADLLNISSIGGRRVGTNMSAVYSASKYAVQAITEGCRLELQDAGVRVMALLPGLVSTPLGSDNPDHQALDSFRQRQARIGLSAEDVAKQVTNMLSPPRNVTIRELVIAPTQQST